jgi:hypothetical protein
MVQIGRRARQRKIKEILLGLFFLFIVLSIVVVVGYFLLFHRPVTLDSGTLCPADGPKGHYVLLVDTTDQLNFTQKAAFEVTLKNIVEKQIPEGYLFSVFVLGENFESNAKPLVELCNPGTGEDKSELTANLKQLRRLYKERFLDYLLNQTEKIFTFSSAKTSPIFEMLQMVSINAFRMSDIKGERRLILMSDMLHNTSQFSMYTNSADYQAFSLSDYGRKVQLDLHGVEVEIYYLINYPQLQTRRNLKFWEDYFNQAGARIVAVRPMEG